MPRPLKSTFARIVRSKMDEPCIFPRVVVSRIMFDFAETLSRWSFKFDEPPAPPPGQTAENLIDLAAGLRELAKATKKWRNL